MHPLASPCHRVALRRCATLTTAGRRFQKMAAVLLRGRIWCYHRCCHPSCRSGLGAIDLRAWGRATRACPSCCICSRLPHGRSPSHVTCAPSGQAPTGRCRPASRDLRSVWACPMRGKHHVTPSSHVTSRCRCVRRCVASTQSIRGRKSLRQPHPRG